MPGKPQRIRDPIHNLIEFGTGDFEQVCWRVISTRPFQRLRRVKQLGFSEFVYPGATHSRFAHSIGVFHTARMLAEVIKRVRGDADDPRRARTAIAAALVHDLGHGPFSHAFEDVLQNLGLGKHEVRSVKLIEQTEVRDELDKFVPNFSRHVAEIINNKVPEDIYAAIVSSQFDADRLDYMRRDRFMTGAQSSAIDFDWLLANLDVRRVRIGQDDSELREIETLVVGQKAVLAAESYVLGLFHLYPTVYFHKATRAAEKIFSALLMRVFRLVLDGSGDQTGLTDNHPLVEFARRPDDSECFIRLDDHVVWGAMPLFRTAKDECIKELSERLLERKLYKAIDVTSRLETVFGGDDGEQEEKRRKVEARIRTRMQESGLLATDGAAPAALDDVVSRDPYRQGSGDDAALYMIYGLDRANQLKELSELSKVVATLKKYETYRLYYREEDESTRVQLEKILGDECHA